MYYYYFTWFVYVLRCRDETLYCGISNNVEARVLKHNAGKGAKYTRSRRPVELVYIETAKSKGAALSREIKIKKLSRKEKLIMLSF